MQLVIWPNADFWEDLFSCPPELASSIAQPAALLVVAAMGWKDKAWWRLRQGVGEPVDPRNTSRWRHHRTGKFPSWEDNLVVVFGDRWKTMVLEPSWPTRQGHFILAAFNGNKVLLPESRYAKSAQKQQHAG